MGSTRPKVHAEQYLSNRSADHLCQFSVFFFTGGRTENIYNFKTNELFHIDRDNEAGRKFSFPMFIFISSTILTFYAHILRHTGQA